MKKIVIISTVPISLAFLIKGLPKYLSKFYDVKLVSSASSINSKISDFEGVEIKGKVDWLEKNANGEYEVVDFKTGKTAQSQSKVEEGLELYVYARGIEKEKAYGKLPVKASLYFIEAGKQVTIDLDESKGKGVFEDKIKDLIQGIMAEKFDATPESYQCRERCQYLDICDAGKKVA